MENIIEAICKQDYESVASLLLSGVDIHFTEDEAQLTPLHHAVTHDDYKMGLLLLNFGANPFQADGDGFSPYDIAEDYNNQTWLKMIKTFFYLSDERGISD